MKIEQEGCDVFHVKKWPRAALDDVQEVKIEITFGSNQASAVREELVMCRKARERLLNFVIRALKPPAIRKGVDDA